MALQQFNPSTLKAKYTVATKKAQVFDCPCEYETDEGEDCDFFAAGETPNYLIANITGVGGGDEAMNGKYCMLHEPIGMGGNHCEWLSAGVTYAAMFYSEIESKFYFQARLLGVKCFDSGFVASPIGTYANTRGEGGSVTIINPCA